MNSKYVYFQNSIGISYFNLKDRFCEENLKHLNFLACDHVVLDEGESQIKEILVGSNPDLVVIVLSINTEFVQIFTWDMVNNVEAGFNDKIESNYQIIWDDHGFPYILTKEKVYFTSQRVAVKAFVDLPDMKERFDERH